MKGSTQAWWSLRKPIDILLVKHFHASLIFGLSQATRKQLQLLYKHKYLSLKKYLSTLLVYHYYPLRERQRNKSENEFTCLKLHQYQCSSYYF